MNARSAAERRLVHMFPLQAARSSNVAAGLALIFMLPWALLASGAALAALPQIFTSWWALAGVVALVGLATGLDWVSYRTFREAFPGRAYLGLTPSALVLRHPLLLRRRLEIPLPDVERVAVSSPTSPGFWEARDFTLEKEDRGLAWIASEDETVEALDATARFFLPLASHVQTDEPNVAVVLRRPVDLSELRRKPISSSDLYVRRLCDVDRAPGFLARVEDPGAVRRAFEERGLLGKLAGEQRSLIEPTEHDVKRLRRLWFRGLVARVVPVLIVARLVWELLETVAE